MRAPEVAQLLDDGGHLGERRRDGAGDAVLLTDVVPTGYQAAEMGGIQPGDMRDFEIPFGTMGPNSKIAMVMRRHMHQYGTTLDHLGKIAVAGRYHASLNPSAYLKKPITIQDYKDSRLVADPVRLLDCVLPANGGKAYIMASPERAPPFLAREAQRSSA